MAKKIKALETDLNGLTDYVLNKFRMYQHEIDLQNPYLKKNRDDSTSKTITEDPNIPCSTDSITFEDIDKVWKSLLGEHGMTEDEKDFWKWFNSPHVLKWGWDDKGTHVTYSYSWPFSLESITKKNRGKDERNS